MDKMLSPIMKLLTRRLSHSTGAQERLTCSQFTPEISSCVLMAGTLVQTRMKHRLH